jgi:hypothetical protein
MQTQAVHATPANAADIVTRAVEWLRTWTRAFDSRVAARQSANVVATHVSHGANHPEFLDVYLSSIPFTNGDAWEVLR